MQSPLLAKACEGGGGATSKDIAKPPLKGADGVVAFAKMFREGIPKRFVVSDHPVCGTLVGFASFLLMPQPPLLRKEGNKTPGVQNRTYGRDLQNS